MNSILEQLELFREQLGEYYFYRQEMIVVNKKLTKLQTTTARELHDELAVKAGKYGKLIAEVTGIEPLISTSAGQSNIWTWALSYSMNIMVVHALDQVQQATSLAIGNIQRDITLGIIDYEGNLIGDKKSIDVKESTKTKEEKTAIISGSPPKASITKATWKDIEGEFGVTKIAFGKAINFVLDKHRKNIIFRDVEHAFLLASTGFSKPAVILAGGVIEELLRLYLEYKNIPPISDNFDGYIKTCEQNGLLKSGISRLSDSVRYFRNLVHLSKEQTKRNTISKATAKGAVSSIFTIANDF